MSAKNCIVLLLAAGALCLAGCSSSTAKKMLTTKMADPAVIAKQGEVRNCQRLGEVRGYSEPTKSGNVPLARLTAKDSMLSQAGEMGATHVVFKNYLGNRRAIAAGIAYKCE